MITRENFIKYINTIKKLREAEDKLNSAGELFSFSISLEWYEQLIIDILVDIFDDNKMNWISYFIYELSFGSEWHEGCVTNKDGTDIPLRDAGELYDLLVSEY